MHQRTYTASQRVIAHRLLGSATTLVACAPQAPDVIFGFVCGEMQASRALVHYLWVKAEYRRCGIASRLLAAFLAETTLPVVTSHLSDRVYGIAQSRRRTTQLTCVTRPYVRYNQLLSLDSTLEVAL